MGSRADEESEIAGPIRKSFPDPLENVDPIIPSTPEEAEAEVSRILDGLNGDQKPQSIQRALGLLKGSADENQIQKITSAIALLLSNDHRSTIVRLSTGYIVAAARTLKSKFVNSVEIIIPSLFKNTTSSISVVAEASKLCIIEIVRNVSQRRVEKSILAEIISKSGIKRQIVAQSLSLMATEWPHTASSPLLKEIKTHISALASDSSASVRETAREALANIEQMSSFNSLPRRSSTKTIRNPSPSKFASLREPNNTHINKVQTKDDSIGEYMPPSTPETAEGFCRILSEIVDAGEIRLLEGLEYYLPQSIVMASKQVPDFDKWESTIPRLIAAFPNEFADRIAEIILSTGPLPQIVAQALKTYGDEAIIKAVHKCEPSIKAAKFYSILSETGISIPSDAAESILALDIPEGLRTKITEELGTELTEGIFFGFSSPSKWIMSDSFKYYNVSELKADTKEIRVSIEADGTHIAKILSSQTKELVDRALYFLYEAGQKFKPICIPYILQPLLEFIAIGERFEMSIALTKILTFPCNQFIQFLSSDRFGHAALTCLSICSDISELVQCAGPLFDSLTPFLSSQSVNKRRLASVVLAKLIQSADRLALQKVSRLPLIQQRMIAWVQKAPTQKE